MPFYDTNPNFRAQHFEEPAQAYKVEQEMKRHAYLAQQQERFQPNGVIAGATVSRPLDLAEMLENYDALLGGLLDQIDALENRLGPLLLDASNPLGADKGPSPVGSPITMRVYQLNSTLRAASEKVARITQSVNL